MVSFIKDVLKTLYNESYSFTNYTFILPSKRACLFLKEELANTLTQTEFAPEIYTIEEYTESIAKLKSISNTETLFKFYTTYQALTKKDQQDSFEQFSSWAQMLIQDFNEIDRYLIPEKSIFNYLGAIKTLDHWSLDPNKTELVTNYLQFWDKLESYYTHFKTSLLNTHEGYQGLVYKQAVKNLEKYIATTSAKQIIFLGFNALNKAEETIIQKLIDKGLARVYWDIDHVFLNDVNHSASYFIRKYKTQWPVFKTKPLNAIGNYYSKQKQIAVYGAPKQIAQAKLIGTLLETLQVKNNNFSKTAIILADENLLTPVLNAIPSSIKNLNITMGYPLKSVPMAQVFNQFFTIHKTGVNKIYYKTILALLTNPYIKPLFYENEIDYTEKLSTSITKSNTIYLDIQQIKNYTTSELDIIDLLFSDLGNNPKKAIDTCSELLLKIKTNLKESEEKLPVLDLEYAYKFYTLFNTLAKLNNTYKHIRTITGLQIIYTELLANEQLDFIGEPLKGLQIMGVLESRVLDFETVIIASVNEGVLPAGKSHNSFIPFDVKREYKLPTYQEKDAVYTYHFYRLLQRAKQIHIIYNTHADILTGGEKSRFITQLEVENIHELTTTIVAPNIPKLNPTLNRIKKTPAVLKAIQQKGEKGWSPSALTNYIRNPIDFYFQSILGISPEDHVEETVANNTLGTIVHNTLEAIYTPFINTYLSVSELKKIEKEIPKTVTYFFKKEFLSGDFTRGKNLIIFEIAKRYVQNFIVYEIEDIKAGNSIKILALEQKNKLEIQLPELDYKTYIKGIVDRVDLYNGTTRIIDYKTGKVEQTQLEVVNWESILLDYTKYSKSIQVLTYALMQKNKSNLHMEAGVYSFKNMQSGFLKFGLKSSDKIRAEKETLITDSILNDFKKQLKALILEINDPKIDFIEKPIETKTF